MQTLVVVDAQPNFYTFFYDLTIQRISRQIEMAIRKALPIVFLEYKGQTDERLINLIWLYRYAFFATKKKTGGGREVLQVCRRNHLPTKQFRVCGIYAEYCVADTVLNLARKYPVEVIKSACGSYYKKADWTKLQGKENIILRPLRNNAATINYLADN